MTFSSYNIKKKCNELLAEIIYKLFIKHIYECDNIYSDS